ncbi:hypothetical protein [Eubacterium sp. MSJ-33]|uniref:hypothetical protein n=1 Tax=Eubacterium sp. MSJ-33 TaxID=2841528 RepID=UPI001C747AE3|nr:hypothetical protein [Eubacterium sp. MSJ-33]QWT52129.1 hypothetical protein KP625_08470 [Eubacterium sp. MSJ-33]
MDKMKKDSAGIIPYIASLVMVILWTVLYQKIIIGRLQGPIGNLAYYVSIFLVFSGTYLMLVCLTKRTLYTNKTKKRNIWVCVCALGVIITFIVFFFFEKKMFDAGTYYMPWHSNHSEEVIFCGFVVILGIFIYFNRKKVLIQQSTKGIILIYVGFALACAYAIYTPNFLSSLYNTHHIHAYFNSVYRVVQGGAYSDINLGIYGFYGIILAPFVKLLGGTYFSFVIALSILTFFSIGCFFYTVHTVVESSLLRILCCFGISFGYIALQGGIYYQHFPHRHIFPGILLGFMCLTQKKKKIRKYGWIICILSIVWNFETGIACTLGYIGFEIINHIEIDGHTWIKTIIGEFLMLPICVFGAFGVVNIYNALVGGNVLTFKTFLFPFIGANQYMDAINTKLEMFPSLWMIVCIILFIVIAVIINALIYKKKEKKLGIIAGAAITVIIQTTYYINRTAYGNLAITLPIITILIAFMVEYFLREEERFKDNISNACRGVVAVAMATILVIIGCISVSRYYILEEQRNPNRDKTTIGEMISAVKQNVPNGTMGVGMGVPEIYSCMGWDTRIYPIDFSDFDALTVDKQKEVAEKMANQETLFVEQESLDKVIQSNPEIMGDFYNSYDGMLIYQTDYIQFYYYTKK